MTIGRKLALGFGVLLLLFVVAGVVIQDGVRRVGEGLNNLTDVEQPASEAAYEMEINTIGTGLGVLSYAESGDEAALKRVREDEREFRQSYKDYEKVADTPEARESGRKAEEFFEEFSDSGQKIIDVTDRQKRAFTAIDESFVRMDRILDDEIQTNIAEGARDGNRKVQLSTDLETDAAEVGEWFGTYLREPKQTTRDRVFDSADDFRSALERFRGLDLTDGEKFWAEQLDKQFADTMNLIDETISVSDAAAEELARFSQLRSDMDDVLDEEMQAQASERLTSAEKDTSRTVGRVTSTLLLLLLLGLLVGSAAAYFISRGITRSLGTLLDGVRKLGHGDLEHKIEVNTKDEVADLAAAFNLMSERRLKLENDVRHLKEVLEERVRERTAELTRALEEIDGKGKSLRESEERYRAVVEQATEGIYLFAPDTGRIVESNTAYQNLIGYSAEELLGMTVFDVVAHDRESVKERVRQTVASGARTFGDLQHRRKDGALVDVEIGTIVLSHGGRDLLCAIVHDVTERKRAEHGQRELARYNRNLFEVNLDAMLTVDTTGVILDANPSLATLTGHPRETLAGRSIFEFLSDPERARKGFKLILERGYVRDYPSKMRHSSGHVTPIVLNATVYRDAAGEIAGVLASARDVTERDRLMADLAHQALHDSLTKLPNRALFTNRLEHALERADHGSGVAVLFMDLDRFKVVNDSLGHGAGDRLLIKAAERLSRCVRPGDTVARIGGDEFVMLLEDIDSEDEARGLAEKVAAVLREETFDVDGQEVAVSVSVGIAVGGSDQSAGELLRSADLAMYGAKLAGKDGYRTFSPEMDEQARLRLLMESDLRGALDRDEIEVHYQPKANLLNPGGIHGFEALARWKSPNRGRVSPVDFIPLAEETGLISPIGRWVLGEACRQAREWLDRYENLDDLVMAVNVSAVQLRDADIVSEVREALRESGLPPGNLCLEITESTLMDDADANLATLNRLRSLGVGLAIDDFGTGYSSFAYLKRFPVNSLKIDRSFVERLELDSEDEAIVETMITLSKNLGMTVVAEGVETFEQFEILQNLGCDYGQGFYFSHPLKAATASELLETILVRGSSLTP